MAGGAGGRDGSLPRPRLTLRLTGCKLPRNHEKGTPGKTQGRNATGPRFLRDEHLATKDPKTAELPKGRGGGVWAVLIGGQIGPRLQTHLNPDVVKVGIAGLFVLVGLLMLMTLLA